MTPVEIGRGKADEILTASDLQDDRRDRREADHEERGRRRRDAEEAIERQAEIGEHEDADRHDVEKLSRAVGIEVEGKAAEADEEHDDGQEKLVGVPLLLGLPQHDEEPGKRGQEEGAVAERVDRLGQERLVGAAFAIKEHMLAECHEPSPLLSH